MYSREKHKVLALDSLAVLSKDFNFSKRTEILRERHQKGEERRDSPVESNRGPQVRGPLGSGYRHRLRVGLAA
jgi:hypothetical protein